MENMAMIKVQIKMTMIFKAATYGLMLKEFIWQANKWNKKM